MSHPPIGSLCSLSSFSHNGGFNTKRSLIKRREAVLQASTEPCVPFLIPRPYDRQALSSYVSCGPFVKISSKTHVICAVYAQIAVHTSFAQICPRSRPIFPVFVEDRIPTTSNQKTCLLYTSPSPRDLSTSRMPSSA